MVSGASLRNAFRKLVEGRLDGLLIRRHTNATTLGPIWQSSQLKKASTLSSDLPGRLHRAAD